MKKVGIVFGASFDDNYIVKHTKCDNVNDLKKWKTDKILEINFRDKSKYGYKYPFMTIKTSNGTHSEVIDTDPYLRALFGDYSVRPSCYFWKNFTIWNCFNVNEIDKTYDDDKGTTRVIVQSQKRQKIIDKLNNAKMKEIPVDLLWIK